MPRITYQKIAEMSPEEIGKMNKKEMAATLTEFRKKFDTRASQLQKQGKYFYSPAMEKISGYYEENPRMDVSKMSRNKAMSEIFRIQEFFQAKTSSVAGARKVMNEQDARIFGVSEKTGKPLKRLTVDQRTKFWELYNEFISQRKTATAAFTSGKIQQALGEMMLGQGKKVELTVSNLEELWNKLQKEKFESEEVYESRNIFSGRRNN